MKATRHLPTRNRRQGPPSWPNGPASLDALAAPTGRVVADAGALLAHLPDQSVGIIITDPPWDLYGGGLFDACASYPRLPVEKVAAILADARRVLVRGGHLYLFAPATAELVEIAHAFQTRGWRLLRVLAWDKAIHSGMGAYRNAWEPVLVFSNGPTRGFNHAQTYSSLLRARSLGRRTAKPWELYEVFLDMSSRPGELALDPFCGTNPLAKAASRLQPTRRWLAGDVLTPEEIDHQLGHRTRTTGAWRTQLAALRHDSIPFQDDAGVPA